MSAPKSFPAERALSVPSFYLTGRQPIRPGAILLAVVLAVGALCGIAWAMGHTGHRRFFGGPNAGRSAGASGTDEEDDKDDDPNQIDTIVLGDPSDAPVPARRGERVSPVHPTILVHLPRFGDEAGLIPDTPAGRLLYAWLAAFNQANDAAMDRAMPTGAVDISTAAQMELRRQTGGYSLLSAKEVQPGVVVFRLRDQTPAAGEALGTLQMRANSNPAAIASFSLRTVPSVKENAGAAPSH